MSDEDIAVSAPEGRWQDALPEELRSAPFLSKAVSLNDAVHKLAHAAKLVGTGVRIPREDSPADVWDEFYGKLADIPGVARLPSHDDTDGLAALMRRLGQPEKATEYSLPDVSDLEAFEWDDDALDALRQYALDANLTDTQFKRLARSVAQQEFDAAAAGSRQQEDYRRELRADWGETLEDREKLVAGWLEFSQAPEELRAQVSDHALSPETMRWLHGVASKFKDEVSPVSADPTTKGPRWTPQQAREEMPQVIRELMETRPADPRYQDLQNKLVHMQRAVNAG